MITILQEKEIIQYLLSKNLNKDLLLEIKDHFLQQISVLMEEEGSGFQEAFLQTKMSWKHELEMVRVDILSFRKVARLEKEMIQKRFRNITLYSLAFSLLFAVFVFTDADAFMYLQVSLLGIMTVLLGYSFIFRRMKLYNYIQLSFHPLVLRNAIAGAVLFSFLYFICNDLTVVGKELMKVFFLYAMAAKIQLLYFNAKKTNVLI
ncbi:hypothetical protein ACQ7CX_15575 [Chryseobacterium arthrosphaerae]|uniref:hypothetical protein n=1 Tax=Chryseobacterium arthrosphaerae TaxID=651561 RepID=UPI001BAE5CB4|nr:hypothetical protein [Chryseobacterium arthrosphaerae]QUY54834.1 hypothetical protein I2F65_18425 [Chryseobacterium arthrosphaerae]